MDVPTTYVERDRRIEADVPFAVHDRHAAEFKLFVDVADPDLLDDVAATFARSPSCRSASISDSLKDRVYMVHGDFATTETESGFVNNVVYPE